jgi:membrane-associated phospholipid phosphatase
MYDAYIACWDAKYHYWTIRPEQADPSITRPFGVALPNFPAYPSGHACAAGAAEAVLTDAVPAASGEVREAAWEMAESRLWGGVHYRFDNDAGLDLGRAVAALVLARGLPAAE